MPGVLRTIKLAQTSAGACANTARHRQERYVHIPYSAAHQQKLLKLTCGITVNLLWYHCCFAVDSDFVLYFFARANETQHWLEFAREAACRAEYTTMPTSDSASKSHLVMRVTPVSHK